MLLRCETTIVTTNPYIFHFYMIKIGIYEKRVTPLCVMTPHITFFCVIC